MTHTFKLARRMARFRVLASRLTLVVASACAGDDLASTGPSAPPGTQTKPGERDSLISTEPQPPRPPSSTGIPFGPFAAWDNSRLKPGTEVFTATIGSVTSRNVLQRLELARTRGVKLILAMTGGNHSRYLTRGVFDLAKWRARMDEYNTPAIQAAIATAVVDGTIIGNSVMDEPQVHGLGDGNTWGPRGTMSKAEVDEMCGYVKAIFPTLPVGVVHGHYTFEPEKSYTLCDFIVSQFSWRTTLGDVGKFRDEALALGRRDGIAIAFSLNIINGGIQAPRGTRSCSRMTTGGRGTHGSNCRMTADQVRDWGTTLGLAGCALTMWQYDSAFMSNAANQQAFKQIAAALASAPSRGCRRF